MSEQPSVTPSREQINAAEAKAASICNVPHVDGAGCIKCNGIVTAELQGRLSEPLAHAEASSESLGAKNVAGGGGAECGSCEGGVAQHDVLRYHHGAQTPNPDNTAGAEGTAGSGSAAAAAADKEGPHAGDTHAPEPGKEQPFYGTEWAGRTAPDGTQVPRLAVCDFGYGANAPPNARDSQMAPVPGPDQ